MNTTALVLRVLTRPVVVVACLLLLDVTSVTAEEQGTLALPDNPYALDPNRACGPISLAFLTSYYGESQPCQRIVQHCSPGRDGTSLEQLQTAATQLGYRTLAFRATAGQLERLKYPAILHLRYPGEHDHFVVWVAWDAVLGKAIVFSPPNHLAHTSLARVTSRPLFWSCDGRVPRRYVEPGDRPGACDV